MSQACDHCGAAQNRATPALCLTLCLLTAAAYGWVEDSPRAGVSLLLAGAFWCVFQIGWEHLRRQSTVRSRLAAAQDQLQRVYGTRNLLSLAFLKLALAHGFKGGLYTDPVAPGWPVVSVTLPQGEVTYHVPSEAVSDCRLPRIKREWDGHDEAERDARLHEFINDTSGEA